MSVLRSAMALLVVAAVAAGCGATEEASVADPIGESAPEVPASDEATAPDATPPDAGASEPLSVVVSDPPLADLVARVAGPEVTVTSVVPMGADGHTYEPLPSDARTLAGADVYIENGMNLNTVVTSFAAANYPPGTPHYTLSDVVPANEVIATDSAEEIANHGHAHSFNAHFWPDPLYARSYVEGIRVIMEAADPDGSVGYQERAAQLTSELNDLNVAVAEAISTIPEPNRKMVVYHDSWSYFGRRYGVPVVGAIQPTDFSEPSAAELRETIEQVRAAGVPAFFGSEVFPSDVLQVIEEESGATYVADLSDDVLPGDPGDPEHSYIGMMVQNVRIIVSALGGDPASLDRVDPAQA